VRYIEWPTQYITSATSFLLVPIPLQLAACVAIEVAALSVLSASGLAALGVLKASGV
jgi:hypothetical protein